MKLIIAGSRDFHDMELMSAHLSEYGEITEVVCGMAPGADAYGFMWAVDSGIPVKQMPANWEKYGKAAGPIRNREMAEYGDSLIAFWDGKSRGTKNMISEAKKAKVDVKVVMYEV